MIVLLAHLVPVYAVAGVWFYFAFKDIESEDKWGKWSKKQKGLFTLMCGPGAIGIALIIFLAKSFYPLWMKFWKSLEDKPKEVINDDPAFDPLLQVKNKYEQNAPAALSNFNEVKIAKYEV